MVNIVAANAGHCLPLASVAAMSTEPTSTRRPKPVGQAPVFHARGITPETRIISVASGKGGVGKSTVAVNLAVSLAKSHTVGLLDADIYGFSIPSMMGVTSAPEVCNQHDLEPPECHGVKVMSMGYFLDEDRPLMWRGPMLGKALRQMLTDVYWNGPEFLIIDTPPGTGDVAMTINELFVNAETLVVTTPGASAQRVAIRSGSMAKETGGQLIGIVENMVDETELFGRGGADAIARELGSQVVGSVRLSKQLRIDTDTGAPTSASNSDPDVAHDFALLAKVVQDCKPAKRLRTQLKINESIAK